MKIKKNYIIEEGIYNSFDELMDELNLNKSDFIEEQIKNFIKENGRKSPIIIKIIIGEYDQQLSFVQKLEKGNMISFGFFEMKYLEPSRIDGSPIFKLDWSIFEYFHHNLTELKEFIQDSLILNITSVEIVEML